MIIIVGDSWGCGEWSEAHTVSHCGLQQYFQEHGYQVLNFSRGGASNWESYLILKQVLNSGIIDHKNSIEIFVFQTEWFRDLAVKPLLKLHQSYNKIDYSVDCYHKNLALDTIDHWSQHLDDLAIKHNVTVKIIGGCSDTVNKDWVHGKYQNLKVVCQSFTNLVVNGTDTVDNPIFGVKYQPSLVETCRKNTQDDQLQFLLDAIEAGDSRENLFLTNSNWFWPNGDHPNRLAHKRLFEFLTVDKNYKDIV
jgi:hypothetical protein